MRRSTRATLYIAPSALPGLSAGKAGRAPAANRPADQDRARGRERVRQGRGARRPRPIPRLEMFETTIQLKPREQWRPGMTPEKTRDELDRIRQGAGPSNIFWVPPIRNRIDMLATGIKSPWESRSRGRNLKEIDRIAAEIERVVKECAGVSSALRERLTGGAMST